MLCCCHPRLHLSNTWQGLDIFVLKCILRWFSSAGEQMTTCCITRKQRPGFESDLWPLAACLPCFPVRLYPVKAKCQKKYLKKEKVQQLSATSISVRINLLTMYVQFYSFIYLLLYCFRSCPYTCYQFPLGGTLWSSDKQLKI